MKSRKRQQVVDGKQVVSGQLVGSISLAAEVVGSVCVSCECRQYSVFGIRYSVFGIRYSVLGIPYYVVDRG